MASEKSTGKRRLKHEVPRGSYFNRKLGVRFSPEDGQIHEVDAKVADRLLAKRFVELDPDNRLPVEKHRFRDVTPEQTAA